MSDPCSSVADLGNLLLFLQHLTWFHIGRRVANVFSVLGVLIVRFRHGIVGREVHAYALRVAKQCISRGHPVHIWLPCPVRYCHGQVVILPYCAIRDIHERASRSFMCMQISRALAARGEGGQRERLAPHTCAPATEFLSLRSFQPHAPQPWLDIRPF